MSLTERLTLVATGLLASLGYSGLAVALMLNGVGVPLPSEGLLPLSGALVRQGRFNLPEVFLVALVAQTLGVLCAHYLGANTGLELVKRYGKYVLIREHELNRATQLFGRYGSWMVLVGSCLPGVRSYIGYPAGVAGMSRAKFVFAYVCGCMVWTLSLLVLGFYLADRLALVSALLHKFALLVIFGLVVLLVAYLIKRRRLRLKA